ncbi:MAG TPA: kelch repeat-containing protein, partial [Polyangiaceae bacterium]
MKKRAGWFVPIAAVMCLLFGGGCGHDAPSEERVSSGSLALYYCRTVTIVATTTYSGQSRSIETDGVTFTPAAQIAIPATIPVTTGGSGKGTADFVITTNDASTDCTYTGDSAVSYVFKSCSDGHKSGAVLSAGEATLTVNDGDESNPVHETVASVTLTEQAGCVPVDAGAGDAGAHDAGSADAGSKDAGSADAGHDSGLVDSGADASDAGSGCSTSADCNDQNPCTSDTCSSKKCKHTTVKSGTACNDGNLCDGKGQCNASGTCVLGPPPTIDASNPCVVGSCNPTQGVIYTDVAAGTSCSDGNLCHGTQTCDGAGHCDASNIPVVPVSTPCMTSACDPATGVVTETPAPAGYACSTDRCVAPQSCDGAGNCASIPPPVVDDGNPCTTDSCGGAGVVHQPLPAGTACGDNSNPCAGAFTCNAAATCIQAAAPSLDDGNACTIDACTPATGITHTPVTIDQNNPCSIGSCDLVTGLAYVSVAAGTSCSDGNACNGAETCDGNGTCQTALPPAVSDGNPCTVDWCDATLGVAHAPAPSGTSCSDGNACDGVELCDANGSCAAGTPPAIDDGNACTADGCDPLLGVTHLPVASDACLAGEATWMAAADGRPSPRDSAAAVYDPASAKTLLFGGENAGAALSDLWSFDGVARTWTPSAATGPSPRAGAAFALDSSRGKLVVFGGNAGGASGTAVLGDTWEYDVAARTWSQGAIGALAPSARAYASMAFDPSRHQVVLLGGASPQGPQAADGPWTWDGETWTLAPSAGNAAPPPRFGASLGWLPAAAHLVLFGGASSELPNAGTPLGDTWELDTSSWTWSAIAGDAPPPRTAQAMALDAARGCLVLFGGTSDGAHNLGDTWEYSGSWSERTIGTAPPPRAGHALVFDAGRAKTLVFGGLSYSSTGTTTPGFDDTWEYDGLSGIWSPAAASVSPAALHTGAVFDSGRGVVVARGDESVPQMWEADAKSLQFTSLGAFRGSTDFGAALLGAFGGDVGPQPMAYVASRARTLFVTMGAGAAVYPSAQPATPIGTWEWDGAQWTSRACTGAPLALSQAALAYDAAHDRVLLYGGLVGAGVAAQSAGPTGAVWQLDPAACTWSPGVAAGPARVNALAAWDSDREKLVVFGGAPAPTVAIVNDTWELDPAGGVWIRRATTGPSARSGAAMTYDARRKKVVLFGGTPTAANPAGPSADLWEYDGAIGAWTQATPGGAAPAPRTNASLVFDPARGTSVLLGGTDAHGSRFDAWEWDGVGWTRRRAGASPAARSGADAAWIPARQSAILFGGVRGDGERALSRDTWFWRDGDWARLGADRPEPIAHVAS